MKVGHVIFSGKSFKPFQNPVGKYFWMP